MFIVSQQSFKRTGNRPNSRLFFTMLVIFLFTQILLCLPALSIGKTAQISKSLDSYTKDEINLLPQLRERIKNDVTQQYMLENKYLVRFLRAGHWNVEKTVELMRENFQWRKKHQVDEVLFQNISTSVNARRFPFFFTSERDKRPVIAGAVAGIDVRHAVIKGIIGPLRRYFIYIGERLVWDIHLTANRTGLETIGIDILVNLAGFSFQNQACVACLPSLYELVESYEKYYPQVPHRVIIINAPRIFRRLALLLKPLATAYTVNNFEVHDLDKSEWQPRLLKLFNKESLPLEFGGTAPRQQLYRITPEQLKIQLGPQAKTQWLAYQ